MAQYLARLLSFIRALWTLQKATPEPVWVPIEGSKPAPKYLWDTAQNARHSVRVICDEEGLSLKNKNILTACIQQESQFNNSAICRNKNDAGQVTSSDWGIVQVNDFFHIGKGKDFPSVEYVVNNPDLMVRWMIKMMKAGKLGLWISYSSGAYKKYL